MPEEVQQQILHSIKGLEDAEMMRPGLCYRIRWFPIN